MINVVNAFGFAGAAFLWFYGVGRVLPLSWGFAAVVILVLPSAAFAIMALARGAQAAADAFLKARDSHRD